MNTEERITDTWQIQNRINLYLLDGIQEEELKDQRSSKEKLVTTVNDKDWLLVELYQPFALETKAVQHIIVKRKDGEPIKKGEPKQIVFVLMVNDPLDIREDYNRQETFPFLDWAICR